MVQGFGFRVSGFGFGVQGFEFGVSGFRVKGFGCGFYPRLLRRGSAAPPFYHRNLPRHFVLVEVDGLRPHRTVQVQHCRPKQSTRCIAFSQSRLHGTPQLIHTVDYDPVIKVNLPDVVNFSALCGSNLVPRLSKSGATKPSKCTGLQGYLTHKSTHHPRTLPWA